MLSCQASVVPQAMQAEAGFTTERRSGTRAATTLRKLPSARPGTKANAASAGFTQPLPLFRSTMSSANVKRWLAFPGVASTTSEMLTVPSGGAVTPRGGVKDVSGVPVSMNGDVEVAASEPQPLDGGRPVVTAVDVVGHRSGERAQLTVTEFVLPVANVTLAAVPELSLPAASTAVTS